MDRIGILGVGNIGLYYARTLLDAGCPVTVYDIDEKKQRVAVELGASFAGSAGEVAAKTDIVLLSLPGSPEVESVMEGKDGVLANVSPGDLVIDTGTTRPETDIRYEKLCADRGVAYVDSPITWRKEGLIMMVGGTPESFGKSEEVLTRLSYKVRHIGPIGSGQLLKFVNQMVLAGQLAVWCESVEFAKTCGIDPKLIQEHLEFDVPEVVYGDDFHGGGHLALHYKDLGYILEKAHEAGAQVPLTNAVHEAFKAARLIGSADWTQPGIVTYWRMLNGSG